MVLHGSLVLRRDTTIHNVRAANWAPLCHMHERSYAADTGTHTPHTEAELLTRPLYP
jgi:hypothetical protein